MSTLRERARLRATSRTLRKIQLPTHEVQGRVRNQKISEYFGENIFDIKSAQGIPESVRKELVEVSTTGKKLTREHAEIVAKAAVEWATQRGATHFCHWFQPLTGVTAEKQEGLFDFDKNGKVIESLSPEKLMQGEPDASSFPNGGSRSTFEARGYTAWDLTSPMFLKEGENGKVLCIPTAFVAYHGEAMDVKTPLLRSITALSKEITKFLHLIGDKDVTHVDVTCGPEQEYFLVDKDYYYARPDLVMTGRTLFGSLTTKNQQLEDHYFGEVPDRVLAFMQELDYELHRLGISAYTRHNEVAPGQFEIAPIFSSANVSSDHNQLVMYMLKKVAEKHDFIVLLHEKPFAGINGSGKHMNWSMGAIGSKNGINLLSPGKDPQTNQRFLAIVSMILESLYRHGDVLRATVASAGNDHRLGANEAPPSIISAFLGDTLGKIFESIEQGGTFTPTSANFIDLGAEQLTHLMKDNTDRNRTSPFAFTGNRFEFRAVGSNMNVGFPMSVLNAMVTEVVRDTNVMLEAELKSGATVEAALLKITKNWYIHSKTVVFNGDGYSDAWVQEAAKRGLPNYRTTPESLAVLNNPKSTGFLTEVGVFKSEEISIRYNVLLERYIKLRTIELRTFCQMVHQHVVPAAVNYKHELLGMLKCQKDLGLTSTVESQLFGKLNTALENLYAKTSDLEKGLEHESISEMDHAVYTCTKLMPLSVEMAHAANKLEELVPDRLWDLPKYYDMLFTR